MSKPIACAQYFHNNNKFCKDNPPYLETNNDSYKKLFSAKQNQFRIAQVHSKPPKKATRRNVMFLKQSLLILCIYFNFINFLDNGVLYSFSY